jgi:hypothetical protein
LEVQAVGVREILLKTSGPQTPRKWKLENPVQQNARLHTANQTARMTESWKVKKNRTCSMHEVRQLDRLLVRKHLKKRDHIED